MEWGACNYDPDATIDGRSCDYDCNCEDLSVCDGQYMEEVGALGFIFCQDAVKEIISSGAARSSWAVCEKCEDTDGDFLDSLDRSCSKYEENPEMCGQYDHDDFWSADMCCACDGGTPTEECLVEVCLTLEACPGENSCLSG